MKRKLYRAPMLLALCGARGAGKTTVAQAIVDRYADFKRMSFADPIREEASEILQHARLADPIVDLYLKSHPPFARDFKDRTIPGLEITPRELLIQVGNGRREEDPFYWVNIMKQRILDCPYHVVIDDLRYDTEMEFVRAHAGYVVELELDGADTDYTGDLLYATDNQYDARLYEPEQLAASIIWSLVQEPPRAL